MVEEVVVVELVGVLRHPEAHAHLGGAAVDRLLDRGVDVAEAVGPRLDQDQLAGRARRRRHVEVERGLDVPAVGDRGAAAHGDLAEAAVGGGARGQAEPGPVGGEVGLGIGGVEGVDDRDRLPAPAAHRQRVRRLELRRGVAVRRRRRRGHRGLDPPAPVAAHAHPQEAAGVLGAVLAAGRHPDGRRRRGRRGRRGGGGHRRRRGRGDAGRQRGGEEHRHQQRPEAGSAGGGDGGLSGRHPRICISGPPPRPSHPDDGSSPFCHVVRRVRGTDVRYPFSATTYSM